jgi:hypothetical protein
VIFDGARPAREHEDLIVAQREAAAVAGVDRDVAHRARAAGAVDELHLLAAESLAQNRPEALAQGRLEHQILVGVHDSWTMFSPRP